MTPKSTVTKKQAEKIAYEILRNLYDVRKGDFELAMDYLPKEREDDDEANDEFWEVVGPVVERILHRGK